MKLQEFPDRIYAVSHQGWLSVKIKLDPKNMRNCAVQEGEMPYADVSMLCCYSDEPWSLQDYEADIAKVLKAQRVCYSCLTLDSINSMIEGTDKYQGSNVWTLDINKASFLIGMTVTVRFLMPNLCCFRKHKNCWVSINPQKGMVHCIITV